ncbi:MAG: glycosyltransferase family 4 protein [Nitrospirota bacterium]|nr:glycosyltransferase family 4 protein [Nitrospirota bacterium]
MNKVRLLYWTPFFLPDVGGMETLVAKILPRLRQRDYELIVVTSHGKYDIPDETEYCGIPVYRFHTRKALGKGNLPEILKIKQKVAQLKQSFRPHLTHIHISDPSAFFHVNTQSAHPAPTLSTFHSLLSFQNAANGSAGLLAKIISSADFVSTVSGYVLNEICRSSPEVRGRSSVIYNGVELSDIVPEPLSFDPPRIVCIGRLVRKKGFDLAIGAFHAIRARFPQARLTIIGDGPLRAELTQQAAALGLSDTVEFMGEVKPEDVCSLLGRSTVAVLPSRHVQEKGSDGFMFSEGFPMVALEAALMGRPIIATRVGGLPEAVVHNQTGLLVEEENIQALADAIAYLLTSRDTAVSMGRSGRLRVMDTFDLEKCVDSYDSLYQRLVQGAARNP